MIKNIQRILYHHFMVQKNYKFYRKLRCINNMKIVVGGIIKEDDKILLIQEAKESCYGMWNIPAGNQVYFG